MQFSDTTNRTGIIQLIEDLTGTQSATTSSYPLASKTRDVNNAYANYFRIGFEAEGRWQLDDTNQNDYPIITDNLIANQQDYSFVTDGSTPANQILDVYRVEVKDSTGFAYELIPIDQFDIKGQALTEFMKDAGIPKYYDKTANGLILYPKPNYNYTEGLRIYYNRTPSYFLSTDTTKKPGIPDFFHEYLAYKPAYLFSLRKGLPQTAGYKDDITRMEDQIRSYYSSRAKDEVKRMSAIPRNPS